MSRCLHGSCTEKQDPVALGANSGHGIEIPNPRRFLQLASRSDGHIIQWYSQEALGVVELSLF